MIKNFNDLMSFITLVGLVLYSVGFFVGGLFYKEYENRIHSFYKDNISILQLVKDYRDNTEQ